MSLEIYFVCNWSMCFYLSNLSITSPKEQVPLRSSRDRRVVVLFLSILIVSNYSHHSTYSQVSCRFIVALQCAVSFIFSDQADLFLKG